MNLKNVMTFSGKRRGHRGSMKNVAGLTLFQCMFFLQDWLNFFNLLCEEVYFAFEECL